MSHDNLTAKIKAMDKTDEFSFILKPSNHGIGVFAVHNIREGTPLKVLGNGGKEDGIFRKKKDVPEIFQQYCISKGDKLIAPQDFGAMPVGWHLNHSKNPNAFYKDPHWHALRDIKAGEEILIDYNSLGEPEEVKKDYYSK